MTRTSPALLIAVLAAVFGGCARSGAERTPDTTTGGVQSAAATPRPDLRAEEQAIRALVAKQGTPGAAKQTDDVIFVSGAYARPVVGRREEVQPLPGAKMEQRRNVKSDIRVQRIEVAQAGDLAYEYSDFTQSYDRADTTVHTSFEGSVLRVWKKVDGEWRIAAMFARPNEKAP
jgi:ketosteroid isomerase-like protein